MSALALSWLQEAAEAEPMRATMVGTLGLQPVTVTAESVVVRMPYALALTSVGGAVHSGALVGLAETAAYLAVLNHEDYDGAKLPALASSSLRCLGSAVSDVTATTRVVLHEARRILVEVLLRADLRVVSVVQTEFRL